jgi:hypothetical protein
MSFRTRCRMLNSWLSLVLVMLLAGCDAGQPAAPSGTGTPGAGSSGAQNLEPHNRGALPPVPESLKALTSEMTALADKSPRPQNAIPMRYLPGMLPYEIKDGKLMTISLAYVPIDDDFLKKLNGLPDLEHLQLAGTKITDAGLENLTNLKSLKSLGVEGTQVTEEGVSKFREAHPGCQVSGP